MRPITSPLSLLGLALLLAASAVPAAAVDLAAATKLVEARRWAEAQRAVEPAARQGDPDAAYLLGRALFGQNRAEESAEWLEKAAAARPQRSDYQMWLGRALGLVAMQSKNPLRQASLATKIKAQFEKAVALDAGNLDARRDLMLYYLQAPGFMGGSLEKAKQQAEAIAARDPVRGHRVKAEIHLHEKQPALALAELEQAIAKAPKDAGTHYLLGQVHEKRGDRAAARRHYETAVELDPDQTEAKKALQKLG